MNTSQQKKERIWVNSEKFRFNAYDGFRVLNNGTIFERIKQFWFFGYWKVKIQSTKEIEVVVLDEAIIR